MAGEARTLGDCFTLTRGTTYQSARIGEDGPILLGLGTICPEGGFRSDSLRSYGGYSPEKLILRPGDLYVSLKDVTQSGALLGSVARLPAFVERGRLTQDTVKLEPKADCPPLNYLYWLLRTPQYRAHCRERATGTTNLGLAREDFLSFEVPPLSAEREVLSSLLDAVDEKIDLNRRVLETLEALARAIFENWFVDFDPVLANAEGYDSGVSADIASLFPASFDNEGLPSGWRDQRIDEIATLVRDSVEPSDVEPTTPYVGLEHIEKRQLGLANWGNASEVNSSKLKFQSGDLLFGKLRPYFHKVSIAPTAGICSSDIFVFRANNQSDRSFMYLALSQASFVASATGGVTGTRMPRADWSYMSGQRFAIGSEALMAAFSEFVDHILAPINVRLSEVGTLSAIRDALLPKLVSGEFRVSEKAMKAVAA